MMPALAKPPGFVGHRGGSVFWRGDGTLKEWRSYLEATKVGQADDPGPADDQDPWDDLDAFLQDEEEEAEDLQVCAGLLDEALDEGGVLGGDDCEPAAGEIVPDWDAGVREEVSQRWREAESLAGIRRDAATGVKAVLKRAR